MEVSIITIASSIMLVICSIHVMLVRDTAEYAICTGEDDEDNGNVGSWCLDSPSLHTHIISGQGTDVIQLHSTHVLQVET